MTISDATRLRGGRGDFTRSDLFIADEVFFTGTAAEIVPVRAVDDHDRRTRPDHQGDPGRFHEIIAGEGDAYATSLEFVNE